MFVTLEGIEGAGKTTQAARLVEALEKRGRRVVAVREPGGTAYGERIREILLAPDPDPGTGAAKLDPRAEALLFAAARAQLVGEVIRPALDRGDVVVSDRFIHSSIAYQGAGRDLDSSKVEAINLFATGGLLPDLVVLLDVDVSLALPRAVAGDRIHSEQIAFHRRVRQTFLELAAFDRDRFHVVNGAHPADEVAEEIITEVLWRLQIS